MGREGETETEIELHETVRKIKDIRGERELKRKKRKNYMKQ